VRNFNYKQKWVATAVKIKHKTQKLPKRAPETKKIVKNPLKKFPKNLGKEKLRFSH